MSTLAETQERMTETEGYRAVNASAVVSLLLGLASAATFLDWRLAVLPAVGLLSGTSALWKIRRAPEIWTGATLARLGVALSIGLGGAGLGWLGYQFLTEVPDGYERISYAQLQPDLERPNDLPTSALALDGKRVFIKGYMYPGAQTERISEFVLCRDNGTCCFGGSKPKLTDMVLVRLADPLRVDFATYARGVAGTFRVRPISAGELGMVYYQLEADFAR